MPGIEWPPVFRGRRRGRPLRRNRRALLDQRLPAFRLDLPSTDMTGEPHDWFPNRCSDLWIEIGFGSGEHLAGLAARHPNVGMVGCEPFLNGVAALLSRIECEGLRNIRIYPDDARPFLHRLPNGVFGRCDILYSDPWPKHRHRNRRLVNSATLDQLARVLRPGALLFLASDDPILTRWMLEQTWSHPAFIWQARRAADWRTPPPGWIGTRYECKALAAGRRPVYLQFVRC